MFKSLFGLKSSSAPDTGVQKIASGVEQSILSAVGARSIPPMASAAQKAFQLATDPKADARDFIEVIESDEGLSARVIKIANSVYFDRGKKSSTIEESVVVIGINELRSLLNATTLSEIFPSRHSARPQLWTHNLGTAIIAKALARRLLPARAELAFLGGLMHDIGKLLLIQKASDDYTTIMKKVEQDGIDFCTAEEEVFPFNHTQVGQLIGQRWNFSPELLSIIGRHHESWERITPVAGSVTLPAIIKAADTVCHALGIGHTRGFHRLKNRATEELASAWQALGIPEADRAGILKDLQKTYELEHELYASAGDSR